MFNLKNKASTETNQKGKGWFYPNPVKAQQQKKFFFSAE